ncbi:MAG: ABC transporter ATP-binding protein [Gordonibacter pamelaeae]|uniref:ABC transporter ATP-binding protein n=1 Tax=Gordonibacter pamelaeae TaxID=471189 RepID=A0A369M5J0_9ACTN|nr:ABC transporter ATP-binding protein [Gordonibacter pamelaeae]MBS6975042.1 ABC transporter ATP-binding protein [Eggerthellaceae bacterium]MBS4897235.1 ABC transporter ATP-binding protein [Gordonibacter pamelaeae]MCB6313091.1 ABC transporter ATP-binding protein/permease [Gordonibacter pamelaeae]MSA61932.1 ATP-binding cassette domain-containing protein [Gordonibacter pamelaeae]RDB66197.1 ABC transporter ATP-binding protein [Gordonibacter pamelaeae]
MRIVRYLKNSKIAVALIVCLLIVQAFTDLALPNYTSQIVDVGIQQSGVEHAATEEMTARTHDLVAMMLPEGDEKTFEAAYDETDQGTYKLNAQGEREQAELDRMVSLPLVAIHYSHQIPDLDLDQALQAYQAGAVQKQQILDMLDKAKEQMGDMGDSIVDQQAIAAARAEYEQLGYNLSDMQMRYLVRIGLTMLGLAALGMAVAILVGFIASRTAAKVGATLRAKLFRQVVSFSDAEVQSFSAASLITRGTNDIQLVQMVTVMLLRMVLYAPILAIGGIIMVSRTNLAMSWIIVLAVVVIGVLIVVLMKVAMPKFKIMQKLIDRVNLVSREILTGLPVIRAFDRQPFEEQRFDVASTRLMKTQLFTNRVMTFMMPLMMLIMNGVSVLIVWVGGSYIDNGTIQTGDLIAFITYAMVIIMGFLMIGMISIMLPRADVAAQRVDEVLSKQPTICDPAPGKARDAELAGRTGGARIVFDDVSFKYGDSAECVLENLDFACEPGQTTAIIGSTGSGKSTVVKLIERFYDVTCGSITVDGVDVRDVSQEALRAQLGYVPQKAFLFSGTIQSNIAYSDEGMPEERVELAAQVAQAADFIASKAEGLDAEVSQGGTNVSGGQRQRLAIARALATEARAYLFDDSFSALDYKTDAALRQELHTRLGGKTVVIVAQRISTILHADKIVVLDDGRIVGQGTHDELMEGCEEYREIAMSQLSAEELNGGDAA